MTFGQRTALIRKKKGLKQDELGTLVGLSGDMISKYERDAMTPSIDVASKISKALNVTIDYLVNGISETIDGDISVQLQQLNSLSSEDKGHVLAVLNAFMLKAKLQSVIG